MISLWFNMRFPTTPPWPAEPIIRDMWITPH